MELFNDVYFKNIKCIIFDFDETMYYSDNIRHNYLDFIRTTIMTLGKKDIKTAERLMQETGFTLTNKNASSFSSQLSKYDIEKKDWDNYRIHTYYQANVNEVKVVDNNLYFKLNNQYDCYIVSNEILNNIQEKAQKYKIDISAFKKIYAPKPEQANSYPKKKELYSIIKEENNYQYNEMLIVGDRMKVDIEPLLELGGSGAFIKNVFEVEELIKQLLSYKNTTTK